MMVVDASAIVDGLLRSSGNGLGNRLFASAAELAAPHLIDVEVAHAFRRLAAKGDITGERGGEMLAILAAMPIRRHAHLGFLGCVWELRANVTAYDAVYVALAQALDAPLLTRDRRLTSDEASLGRSGADRIG